MGKRKARQQVNPHVEQRGGLATQVRLDPDPTLFKRLGGRRVVARIVAAFYERIAADARLRPKFGGDLTQERANQQRFFEEWLGGTPLYSQHVAKRGLRQIHEHIHINKQDAATWLRHFAAALAAAKVAAPLRREVLATLTPLARALVNEQGEAAPHEQRCRRTQRWAAVNKAAATGNVKVVQQAIVAEPRLLKGWADHMQTLLYLAAGKGRANVVQLLLEAGADPNSPSHVWWACGLETPLLAARRRRRTAIVKLLHEYGAVADIFTLAALGDLEGVAGWLERDLDLLNATDPAHDIFRATPLLHAVTSGQSQVALELLRRGAEVGPLSTVLVRAAAEQHDVPLVQSLLHHGADASRVGPGRWVLHAELSQLLTRHGADVNYASNPWATWIWRACTGNHHQQDDPDYVRALIAHGADVNDRHWWGRAALHFACKAGFVRTVRVLLEAGADPNLRDEAGETPLFHVGKASPRVDRRPLIAALLDAGANPQAVNRKGKSALIV